MLFANAILKEGGVPGVGLSLKSFCFKATFAPFFKNGMSREKYLWPCREADCLHRNRLLFIFLLI